MKLDYVRMLVTRVDECFRFYRDVLGLKVTWGKERDGYASFDTGLVALALFKQELMARDVGTSHFPSEAVAQDSLALILGIDGINATAANLSRKGVTFVTEPRNYADYRMRAAQFRDPDGTLVEMYRTLSQTEWTEDLRKESESYRSLRSVDLQP